MEKHENLSQCRKSPDRDLSLVSAEYRAAVQMTECLISARGGVLLIHLFILQLPITLVHLVYDELARKLAVE